MNGSVDVDVKTAEKGGDTDDSGKGSNGFGVRRVFGCGVERFASVLAQDTKLKCQIPDYASDYTPAWYSSSGPGRNVVISSSLKVAAQPVPRLAKRSSRNAAQKVRLRSS